MRATKKTPKKKLSESDDASAGVFIWTDEGETIIQLTDMPVGTTTADVKSKMRAMLTTKEWEYSADLPAEGYVLTDVEREKFSDLPLYKMTVKQYVADIKQSYRSNQE